MTETLIVELSIMFGIGMLGAGHCIGMCGGILTAMMVVSKEDKQPRTLNSFNRSFAYNLGRILSYSFAGILAGLLGASIIGLSQSLNLHLFLQIFACLVLVMLALKMLGLFPFRQSIEALTLLLWQRIQPLGHSLLPINSFWRALVFGMLWGWLPCGLVYSALMLSVSSAEPLHGMLAMFMFGLGTLPAMLGVGYFSEHLGRIKTNYRLRIFSAVLMILIAISLPVSSLYFSEGHDHHAHHQNH